MPFEQALKIIPTFVLVVFRLAGMMMYTPFFGSARVPRRVKGLFTVVLALGMVATVRNPPRLPETPWELTIGIGGEIIFGLAMGMACSFTFIAAQWSGEIIGQQMGLNAGAVFDPQYGGGGSLVGDMYSMLCLIIFMLINGHHALIRGVAASFSALPLLSAGLDHSLLDLLIGLFESSAMLAVQLAAPMLVTMIIVDLALGVIGKTMPQMNVMTAGLTIRAVIGTFVLLVGIALTSSVIGTNLLDGLQVVQEQYLRR